MKKIIALLIVVVLSLSVSAAVFAAEIKAPAAAWRVCYEENTATDAPEIESDSTEAVTETTAEKTAEAAPETATAEPTETATAEPAPEAATKEPTETAAEEPAQADEETEKTAGKRNALGVVAVVLSGMALLSSVTALLISLGAIPRSTKELGDVTEPELKRLSLDLDDIRQQLNRLATTGIPVVRERQPESATRPAVTPQPAQPVQRPQQPVWHQAPPVVIGYMEYSKDVNGFFSAHLTEQRPYASLFVKVTESGKASVEKNTRGLINAVNLSDWGLTYAFDILLDGKNVSDQELRCAGQLEFERTLADATVAITEKKEIHVLSKGQLSFSGI